MSPYTQPMTLAQKIAAREWVAKNVNMGKQDNWPYDWAQPDGPSPYGGYAALAHANELAFDPSNPVEFDWLKINEEFS